MSEKFSWTANFGRWSGVPLQVHVFFLLFAVLIFCVEWHDLNAGNHSAGTALATIAIVFFLAVAHEMAHAFAAVNLGGRLEEMVITPWGGESKILMPTQPKGQLVVHCAGPFLNLMLFATGAIILMGQASLWDLMDPLSPHRMVEGVAAISFLKIATWVNFQMFVVNLIPAFPFDASRIIRTSVLTYNPRTPAIRLEAAIMAIGIASGLVLFVFSAFVGNRGMIQPSWFILVSAGILLIFSARYGFHSQIQAAQQEVSLLDEYIDYDSLYDNDEETDADTYLEEFENDIISDWLQEQQANSENAERSVEREEERRVDVILEKLHKQGIESLSDEERSFLNRISQQYRRRRKLRS